MPIIIGHHNITKGAEHWLTSPKRQELFRSTRGYQHSNIRRSERSGRVDLGLTSGSDVSGRKRGRVHSGSRLAADRSADWDIEMRTTDGKFYQLRNGGRILLVDGKAEVDEPSREYEMIYERFASLIDARESDVDAAPLRLVADAFMVGRRSTGEAFCKGSESE